MNNLNCKVPPTILPIQNRIIAIGDIHGDLNALINCLKIANLIDDNFNWLAKPLNTIVIQVGDQLDRGGRNCNNSDEANEIKIFNLLDKLHLQAQKYNGGVYSLLGNHEIMNVMGNVNYASPMGIKYFGDSIDDRIDAFKPGGNLAKRFACTRNVVMKVGSFLFVHAGFLPKHLNLSLDQINQIMREYLIGQLSNENQKYFEDYFINQESLLWTRKLVGDHKCDLSKVILDKLELNGIVIGHTPQPNGITSSCKNKIWNIDTGMSQAFCNKNKNYQVLEILNDGKPNESNNNKPIRILKL